MTYRKSLGMLTVSAVALAVAGSASAQQYGQGGGSETGGQQGYAQSLQTDQARQQDYQRAYDEGYSRGYMEGMRGGGQAPQQAMRQQRGDYDPNASVYENVWTFARFDLNNDGVLTEGEVYQTLFGAMDVDRSGSIAPEEYRRYAAAGGPQPPAIDRLGFGSLDRDADQRITQGEMFGAVQQYAPGGGFAWDINNDGVVTRDEWRRITGDPTGAETAESGVPWWGEVSENERQRFLLQQQAQQPYGQPYGQYGSGQAYGLDQQRAYQPYMQPR